MGTLKDLLVKTALSPIETGLLTAMPALTGAYAASDPSTEGQTIAAMGGLPAGAMAGYGMHRLMDKLPIEHLPQKYQLPASIAALAAVPLSSAAAGYATTKGINAALFDPKNLADAGLERSPDARIQPVGDPISVSGAPAPIEAKHASLARSHAISNIVNRARQAGLHKMAAHLHGTPEFTLKVAAQILGTKLVEQNARYAKIAQGLAAFDAAQ